MKISSRNTVVLRSSIQFNEDKTKVIFQANTELFVEGNPYTDLYTPMTVFNLECATNNIANIDIVAQEQVNLYISQKYPETNV